MGNDLDVCSKDEELIRMFEEQHGPVDETSWQFFNRSYLKFCHSIINPKRWEYETEDLTPVEYTLAANNPKIPFPFDVTEFKVFSQGNTLHCCFWKYQHERNATPSADNPDQVNICILYMHTNLRALNEAIEVLPLAKRLRASVLGIDLPGCGKSEGSLNGDMDIDVEHLLEWAQCLAGDDVKVVLWARGMATAPGITLAQRLSKLRQTNAGNPLPYSITCMVLDSPFTSMEDLIKIAIDKMHSKGYSMTKALLKLFIKRVIKRISHHLNGLNIFSIKPIQQVKDITIPCFFLAAQEDNYIPSEHSVLLSRKWAAPTQISFFQGRHFRRRLEDDVLRPIDFLKFYCIAANSTGSSRVNLSNSTMPPPPPTSSDAMSSSSSTQEKIEEFIPLEEIESMIQEVDQEDDGDDVDLSLTELEVSSPADRNNDDEDEN